MSLTHFANVRLATVARLANGEAGGSYVDAYLLASATLSGVSAYAWPGDGQDKRRFIEAWARFAPSALEPTRVSLPLLVQHLRLDGRQQEAETLEGLRRSMFGFGNDARILTGDDVDLSDAEVRKACPQLSLREVRKFSYPALFYTDVRSFVVHEGQLGERSTGWPMTRREAGVSYGNLIVGRHGSRRQIHFHIPWLIELISSVAANLDGALTQAPLSPPDVWWCDET